MLSGMAASLPAQQADSTVASNRELPDAPGSEGTTANPVSKSSALAGTVVDSNGTVVAGARVALSGTAERAIVSGDNGEFFFSKLPPGSFRVTVTGAGMGTFVSPEIRLAAEQTRLVPDVVLPVAASMTEIRVSGDRNELAEEQVHIAVEQRVLGILPNFYSSYDWHAPPLGPKQKFELAFRAVTDPTTFLGSATVAGFEQATNSFPGYGLGAQGYAKRYGAAYADDFIGRMMGSAVFPSLFHQDPRYFYKGTGSIPSRALYAVRSALICRGDNGGWQPNYSHVLGSFTTGGISNLYYPAGSRGVSLTLLNGLIETAGNAGNNLVREFVLKRLTARAAE
jgi:hypothetical protein